MNGPRPHQPERPANGTGPSAPMRSPPAQVLAILETISDTLVTLDPAWRFTYLNRQALQEARRPAEALLGQVIWEVYPHLLGTPVEAYYRQAMRDQVPRRFESRGVYTGRWWEIHLYPSAAGLTVHGRDASERHQAGEVLRASEEMHRLIVANIDEIIYSVEITGDLFTGRIRYVSDQVEAILGYQPAEFVKDQGLWQRIIHPDDLPAVTADTEAMYARREGGTREYRLCHKHTGAYHWVEDKVVLPLDAQGRVTGLQGVARDITARKQMEEQLRASEERHRLITELTSDYTYTGQVEPDQTLVLDGVSEGFARVTGYRTLDQLNAVGGWLRLVNPEDMPDYFARLQKVLAGQRDEGEVRLRTRSGESRWVRFSAIPIVDAAQGRVVRIVGAVHDVTERRQAEEALRRLSRQHELILAAAGEGIYGLDLDGNTTFVNPAAARMLGWEAADLIGRNMHRVLHHTRPDGTPYPITECPIYASFRDGAVHRVCDEVFWRQDGTSFPVEYISTPLREDGRLVGAVVTFADTTARQQAERKLREYADRLRTLSRRLLEVQEDERRHLARELHDEIGQLLTGLHLALERGRELPAGEMQTCLREGQRLVKSLTARVRDLSMRLRPTMLDDLGLRPALMWHLERYKAQTGVKVAFEHRGLERRFHPAAVETAAYRIVQEALTNVARHAGVKEVVVRVWADRDRLCVQVEDHGVGFDPRAVLAAGTSSGLSGMRERAVLLGGRLVLDSAPGEGTRVTAEMPVREAEERSHRAVDTLLSR